MTLEDLLGALWQALEPAAALQPVELNELLEVLLALLRREE